MRTSIFSALAVVVLLTCGGCGPKSETGFVHGKVMLDGKPLSAGNVMTQPAGGRGAIGVIQNGEFDLKTSGKDGAVPGTHKVAISATEQTTGGGPEAGGGKSLVPDKYSNPASSGLTIEVKAGQTVTPTLELKSQ